MLKNPYNPSRKYPFDSFFELRDYEEYMDRRKLKKNLKDSIFAFSIKLTFINKVIINIS